MMATAKMSRMLMCILSLLSVLVTASNEVYASNGTEIPPASQSPRFIVSPSGASQFPSFEIAPLGNYADISESQFMQTAFHGRLVYVTPNNVNNAASQDLSLVSCDAEDYAQGYLLPADLMRLLTSSQNGQATRSIILFSRSANHCVATTVNNLPSIFGIFTMLDPTAATRLLNISLTQSASVGAAIQPDRSSNSNSSDGSAWNSPGGAYPASPTTAIAMIILYSITGIITALFVLIIVTGAVRAHRHPERYGPRNVAGRGRQSRAKGIARAMLETLPIVKFGDHSDSTKTGAARDIELNSTTPDAAASASASANDSSTTNEKKAATSTVVPATAEIDEVGIASSSSPTDPAATSKPDGTDEAGHLGCSICTEDFNKGEEVRVLPCNHKFHPDCVDPWLLNVSGTCPLCRIDLRGDTTEEGSQSVSLEPGSATGNDLAPPLASPTASNHRNSTVFNLRAAVTGSREERIAALRRFRHERQRQTNRFSLNAATSPTELTSGTVEDTVTTEEEQRGLARRFRERFRIRTRRYDVDTPGAVQQSPTSPVVAAVNRL